MVAHNWPALRLLVWPLSSDGSERSGRSSREKQLLSDSGVLVIRRWNSGRKRRETVQFEPQSIWLGGGLRLGSSSARSSPPDERRGCRAGAMMNMCSELMPYRPDETKEEALKRRLYNLAARMNNEPPVGKASVFLIVMWRYAMPSVLKNHVASIIARGGLTWEDIFEDGNIIWAIRPRIAWRSYVRAPLSRPSGCARACSGLCRRKRPHSARARKGCARAPCANMTRALVLVASRGVSPSAPYSAHFLAVCTCDRSPVPSV